MSFKVSHKRHIAKTISYRIISTTIGVVGMWIATGSLVWGATFGIVELVYKPIQYYIHERVWYKFIKFGLIEDKKKEKKETLSKTTTRKPNTGKKVLNYSSNR